MNTAIDLELAPAVVPVRPPLKLRDGNPFAILSAAKRVALKAEWSLPKWDEFTTSFRACFAAEEPEEQAKALDVIRTHFELDLLPGFSFDPSAWDHRQHAHDD